MTALDEIGRAILMSLTPAQLQALLRRLEIVGSTAATHTERGLARDLVMAMRERSD